MSHQTGIKPNDKLISVFAKSRSGKLRLIKVSISNEEELTCTGIAEAKKDWTKDYDNLISPMIEEQVPCYILYRLDSKTSLGYAWLLLSWIPDSASIRQKMVYASTKATLKTEFGSAHITEELHATTIEETTLEGYNRHKLTFSTPGPLTTREEEMLALRKSEVNTEINTNTRQQFIGGIEVPLTDATKDAVKDLLRGTYDYLQFRIDLETEIIHVTKSAIVPLQDLSKQVPGDQARYHLYLFKHTHEGDYLESYLFIYSMPGYTCSVRERMMYSSCKAPFVDNLKALGVDIAKKIEVDSGSELTEDFLQEELHPKRMLYRPAFEKPKGPPNRGAKRLTRPQEQC